MTSDGPVAAAIFDIGNVVIDICLEDTARYWARATGTEAAKILAAFVPDTGHHALERGQMSVEEYYWHVVDVIGRPLEYGEFLAGWNCIFRGACEGIDRLLQGLRRRVRLVALTNTNAQHAEIWLKEYADLLRHFERIFLSHEIGARKPEPHAFAPVLEFLRLPPLRIVFIDDLAANVAAAEAMGMKGIVARSTSQIAAELAAMGVETNG